MANVSQQDAPLIIKILSFIIPLVGIILFFVKLNSEPVYAKSCITWAVVSIIIGLVFGFIF